MRSHRWIVAAAIVGCSLGLRAAEAQDTDSFTPMPLDAGFGRMDLTPPSIPPEQIIKQFAANEAEFKEALNHYTYRRTARVDTIDDDTKKVDGEWYEVDDVIFSPDGARLEKVVDAPANTLTRIMMSPSDLEDLQHGYNFVVTTDELPSYDIKYIGKQKVDELDCYVFDVAPKIIEKKKRYFDGRVWVDSRDLQVVVSDGRMVPDDTRKNKEDLHAPFITWRQQIDGHYWFPVYSKGEGILHFAGGYGYTDNDVHVRQVVKYSDYKRFGSSTKIFYGDQEITKPDQPENQPNQPPQAPPQ
ncbi:MAG: hypothetical protein WBP85_14245 [Terracidiphilus sp.]